MASSSSTVVLTLAFLYLCAQSEAASSAGIAGGGAASWRAPPTSVISPDLPEDSADVASFIFAGTELHRPSSGIEAMPVAQPASKQSESPALLPDGEDLAEWEAAFIAGVFESKMSLEADESNIGAWVSDTENSGAAVPSRMLRAEVLLQAADSAPTDKAWKEKTAERALRFYYHAKWLAERNYARAAEHRYREAARLARNCRRSVLASHALARLGYFLVHWKREAEAAEVLEESMKLNTKSNPLAPYLYGVLERKSAAGDAERLRAAEEAIMNSGEQPSEELELERNFLMDEIGYWREAEAGSARQCLASSDAAYVLICLCGSAVSFLQKMVFK